MKDKFINIRTVKEKHFSLLKKANELGMTITGMIRVALRKVFGIEI